MNKNISKIVLSLSAILALSGCSTEDDYKAKANNNSGLSGYVIADSFLSGVNVCMDTNKNGLCDTGESSVSTNANGYYTFSEGVSKNNTNTLLIAQATNDTNIKYILSANQNSTTTQNITPYTTLVVNEDTYNLKVKNGDITSNAYLLSKLTNLDDSLLNGANYLETLKALKSYDATSALTNAKNLIGSYETAYALKSTEPLLSIASVVDEIIKTSNYNVSVSSISTQEVTSEDSNDTVEDQFSLTSLNQKVTWSKNHEDEVVIGSNNSNDKMVSYSKWHNRLTILDTSTKTQTATLVGSTNYLNVDGARDTVDSTSGATEEILSKIEISSDGNTIYSLVSLYKEDDSSNTGVGIYKTDISAGLPSELFARKSVGDTDYYNNSTITDIHLASDNSLLVANNENGIFIFNTNDLSSPTTINTDKDVKSIAISDDNKYIYAGLYKRNASSLGIYSVSTKELLGEYLLDNYPTDITIGSNNDIFVGNTGKKSIYHLDISTASNITLKYEFTFNYNIRSIKESIDKKLLIVGTSSNLVHLRDINNTSRSVQVNTSDIVTNAYSLTDDKIAVTAGTTFDYYSMINVPASVSSSTIDAWETTYRK